MSRYNADANRSGRKRQSPAARLLTSTLAGLGARVGLCWIALLVLVSVFAPLIANSRPLIQSTADGYSSPAMQAFDALDWTLLIGFALAIFLIPFNWSITRKVALWLAVCAMAYVVLLQSLNTSRLTVHEQYRESARISPVVAGWQLMAPIPFSPRDYLRDFGDTSLQAPTVGPERTHWFGTEENGADVLSRMIHASRLALGIGLVATGIALTLGVLLGGLMGYLGGLLDMLGMRLVEIFEAVPTLFLLLTFVAFFERSIYMMMVIIGLTSWPAYARFVRAEFLRLRDREFVQAARVAGLPLHSIMFRHILPNAAAPVLVAASFGVASAILAEATLSFLGLGLVDDPSWGQMLNQAVQSSSFNWWMALFPGFAIFMTVFSYNLLGESLRDALDPLTERAASS